MQQNLQPGMSSSPADSSFPSRRACALPSHLGTGLVTFRRRIRRGIKSCLSRPQNARSIGLAYQSAEAQMLATVSYIAVHPEALERESDRNLPEETSW